MAQTKLDQALESLAAEEARMVRDGLVQCGHDDIKLICARYAFAAKAIDASVNGASLAKMEVSSYLIQHCVAFSLTFVCCVMYFIFFLWNVPMTDFFWIARMCKIIAIF